jgi:hypothetical protein
MQRAKFEEQMRRILAAPPLPKKPKYARKKPAQNPHLN